MAPGARGHDDVHGGVDLFLREREEDGLADLHLVEDRHSYAKRDEGAGYRGEDFESTGIAARVDDSNQVSAFREVAGVAWAHACSHV